MVQGQLLFTAGEFTSVLLNNHSLKQKEKLLKNSSRSGVFSKITPMTCGATEY